VGKGSCGRHRPGVFKCPNGGLGRPLARLLGFADEAGGLFAGALKPAPHRLNMETEGQTPVIT